MADQTFTVNSGFWNSIGHDRLYDADDMNKPYKRIVTEGVFPEGDIETNGFATQAVGGMTLEVGAGGGLFSGRWVDSNEATSVTVPDNSAASGRKDSVILRIDGTGRQAQIIYRTGTPSATPVPPALENSGSISEWRLANVSVAAGASTITQSNIEDTRTFAVLDTGIAHAQFDVVNAGTGGGVIYQKDVYVRGKVATFYIAFDNLAGLRLKFPDAVRPSAIYLETNNPPFFIQMDMWGHHNVETLIYDADGGYWYFDLYETEGNRAYLSGTYFVD